MNKARRSSLQSAVTLLEQAADKVRDVMYDEQRVYDNTPENLQNGDRYEEMEGAIDAMDDALSSIGEAKDHIWRAVG